MNEISKLKTENRKLEALAFIKKTLKLKLILLLLKFNFFM